MLGCDQAEEASLAECKEYYYYQDGQKINLELFLEQVYLEVKNFEKDSSKRSFIAPHPFLELDPRYLSFQSSAGLFAEFKPEVTCAQLQQHVQQLQQDPEINYVSPCIIMPDGTVQGIMNSFGVTLKPTTTHADVLELVEAHRIKSYYVDTQNAYFFEVDKTAKGNALELANKFYETGKFESAEATFVSLPY
jgi:hypothetical protein